MVFVAAGLGREVAPPPVIVSAKELDALTVAVVAKSPSSSKARSARPIAEEGADGLGRSTRRRRS